MCSHGDTSPQTVKCCTHGSGVGGLHQTLDEMSFERGPWYPASNGDYEAIRRYLDKGGDPSVIDTAGYTPLVSYPWLVYLCLKRLLQQV